jgi:chemotaxis protein methyltransferase CheR
MAAMIEAELGIQMPERKAQLLISRITRRMRVLGIESAEEYCRLVLEGDESEAERSHFIDAVTTNKTDFFREPQHFDFLLKKALPYLGSTRNLAGSGFLKVWSCGCSTGQEPYTLAMLLENWKQQEAAQRRLFDYRILGTDLSQRVLDQARQAIYPSEVVEPVPVDLRKKFLLRSRSGDQVRVIPELRSKLSLYRLNLMDDQYPIRDTYDLIFFRNVMIYFSRETQRTVLHKLMSHLAPGGFLFVGHSESVYGQDLPGTIVTNSVVQKTTRI